MFNQYQPYQYGPMQPIQPIQPIQPVPQTYRQALGGRAVSGASEIGVGDVPQDGMRHYFPVSDGSAIYVKAWNAAGNIDTLVYVPQVPEPPAEAQPDVNGVLEAISARLEAIERAVRAPKRKKADDDAD